MPRKPDIIVIGAMKAATSSICSFLEDHPAVHMPPRTEPCFFSHDSNWEKGSDWYLNLFRDAQDGQLIAEGSNDYTFGAVYPDAPARMASYCPDAKLIFMVRHPIERIISAWIQNRADMADKFPPTLDQAVAEMPDLYIDPSLYMHQLQRYLALYAEDRIYIGFMEEMSARPDSFFSSLCAFLNIEAPQTDATQVGVHKNASAGKAVPTQAYSTLKNLPFARRAKAFIPKGVQRSVRNLLSKRIVDRPRFSPQAFEQLVEQVRPDAEAFLKYTGRPLNTWTWSQDEA